MRINRTPPKTGINSSRTLDEVERLTALAEQKGWRSLSQAQAITSNYGIEFLENLPRLSDPEHKDQVLATLTSMSLMNDIDEKWNDIPVDTWREFASYINTKADTRHDTKVEMQREIDRLKKKVVEQK